MLKKPPRAGSAAAPRCAAAQALPRLPEPSAPWLCLRAQGAGRGPRCTPAPHSGRINTRGQEAGRKMKMKPAVYFAVVNNFRHAPTPRSEATPRRRSPARKVAAPSPVRAPAAARPTPRPIARSPGRRPHPLAAPGPAVTREPTRKFSSTQGYALPRVRACVCARACACACLHPVPSHFKLKEKKKKRSTASAAATVASFPAFAFPPRTTRREAAHNCIFVAF